MNQSILTEKTTIVQEFNNLKNEFQVQKTLFIMNYSIREMKQLKQWIVQRHSSIKYWLMLLNNFMENN
jgi:hypothetical protein